MKERTRREGESRTRGREERLEEREKEREGTGEAGGEKGEIFQFTAALPDLLFNAYVHTNKSTCTRLLQSTRTHTKEPLNRIISITDLLLKVPRHSFALSSESS